MELLGVLLGLLVAGVLATHAAVSTTSMCAAGAGNVWCSLLAVFATGAGFVLVSVVGMYGAGVGNVWLWCRQCVALVLGMYGTGAGNE